MGGKHLKRLRAEKAKVQLKKKKLPKGQNITDTSFKVKKILTVEQLKKVDKDEPVSNWNVPLKDLLIRLNHYNFTTRLNSLNGVKELLTNYPEILQGPSLKPLISKLLDLLTDEEHKIRIMAMDLLSHLFSLIPPSALLPFHDIISVYLGCAMTHRNSSVQQDSLKFIDVMIRCTPEALKDNFWSITQNFMRIMNKILREPQQVSSKGSKQDLVELKMKIFSRFYLFMTSGLSGVEVKGQSSCKDINTACSARQSISLRQSNDQYKQVPDLSSLFMSSGKKNATLAEKNNEDFKSLCSLVIPLVFETWLEFCPEQKFSGESTECILTENTAELLSILLKIIMFLYESGKALGTQMEVWFKDSYGATFKKCFTTNFPYSLSGSRKRSKSSKPKDFLCPSCVLQNLIICYLSFSFKFVQKIKSLRSIMENYISGTLSRKNPVEIEVLSKVVEEMINTSKKENSNFTLGMVISAYNAAQSPELRRELSKALLKIVLEEDAWQKEESIVEWMRSLPEQLCKPPILRDVIETILLLANRPEGAEVLKEVEDRAFDIIQNLHNCKVEGIDELEGQKMIVNILYRCKCETLQEILYKEALSSSQCSQSLKDYINNVFHYKVTNSILCS